MQHTTVLFNRRRAAVMAMILGLFALSGASAYAKVSTLPAITCPTSVGGYASSPAGGRLAYNGGPVQTCPVVYLVFWQWPASDAYAQYMQQNLENFLSHVGGSTWNEVVTQYCQGTAKKNSTRCDAASAAVGNPTTMWSGQVWADGSNALDESRAGVAAEAARAAARFKITDGPDTQIVVALPPKGLQPPSASWLESCAGVNPGLPLSLTCGCPPGVDCGSASWHGYETVSGIGTFTFTDLANQEWGDIYLRAGGDLTPYVEGHELAESETDPLLNAWTGRLGSGEIGDLCQSTPPQPAVLNGMAFDVPALWSNADGACVEAGTVTVP